MDLSSSLDQIDLVLSKLFVKYQSKLDKPAVFLSGGIDSTVIAFLMKKYWPNFTILSFGTQKSDDRPYVEMVCSCLKLPYHWLEITKDDVCQNLDSVANLLKKNDLESNLTQISLASGYFLAFQKVRKLGIKVVFTGQGPDILLGGYARYRKAKNLNLAIRNDLPDLKTDIKRDGLMADFYGVTLVNPYLEKEFVRRALAVPADFKINGVWEKYILREYGQRIGVPEEIITRHKKAFQYSTGVQKLVSECLQAGSVFNL